MTRLLALVFMMWCAVDSHAQPVGDAGAPPDAIAAADRHWRHRDNPQVIAKLDAVIDQLLRERPNDYEVLWRAARNLQWKTDGMPEGAPERGAKAKEAWALAERAVALQPSRVEGHYWAALSIGSYALGVGIFQALREGLEPKFQNHLNDAIRADMEYELRGALLARARAYYAVPWPKRDLKKSEIMMKQTVERYPQNLRAWLYLSETQLRRDHPSEAMDSIQHVFNGSDAYDPPEARRVKAWGNWTKAQIEKEQK